MTHPKMGYTYVGVDSHKDTHTAVFLDCFFEILGEASFDGMPSSFPAFLEKAESLKADGTELMFGLEDASMYGRLLAAFLVRNGHRVKHVNALLVARERKNRNIVEKTDAVDAECAARVLISKFGELPGVDIDDRYYMLRTLVMRRGFIVKNNISLMNHLHSIILQHYPGYQSFFPNIDSMASLAFLMRFPSTAALEGVTHGELAAVLMEASNNRVGAGKSGMERAREILDMIQDTALPFQEIRDEAVRSTVRQIQANLTEIKQLEKTMALFLKKFECTLTSMDGIDIVCAAQILACIGDIKNFPTPAKLARYAGIAPVTYASGQKTLQYANQRGNRELNSVFYLLAVRLITTVGVTNRIRNPFFYEYYHKKISEGKTKRQALKCVQRRLVNIIWTMMKNSEEYVNPPLLEKPKETS